MQEADDLLQLPPIDPRQGTLLGFELPAEALALIADEQGPADAEPVAPVRVARSKPAVADVADAAPAPAPAPAKALFPDAAQPQPQLANAATASENGALDGAREPKLLSPGAALASVRQQAARRPAQAARSGGTPAPIEASAPTVLAAPPVAVSSAAAAVAALEPVSLQEALSQERLAAQERWRRTRHWLGLALGGLVLLFAISVAQTVALISFSHRAQADQQKTQSALNEQRAALAGLASSTSALAALIPAPAPAASAPEASTPRPARHVRLAHARRLREKADKAAKADKAEKTKAAAR